MELLLFMNVWYTTLQNPASHVSTYVDSVAVTSKGFSGASNNFDMESMLWVVLGLGSLVFWTSSSLLLTLGCSLVATLAATIKPASSSSSSLWHSLQITNALDVQGLSMSCTLPSLLLHTMSLADNPCWEVYATILVPIHAYPSWSALAALATLMTSNDLFHPYKGTALLLARSCSHR